ncbi:MAG: hypothetical protein DRP45_05685, partial [Candidatus Zixiibacteriota bacterium]
DGYFNSGDRLVFYGEAVDRWLVRAGYPISYINNTYTNENIYWLAVAGNFSNPAKRMEQVDGSLSGGVDTIITTFWRRVHAEQDRLISREVDGHFIDYYTWFWSDQTTLELSVTAPGALESDSAHVHLNCRTGGSEHIDLTINGISAIKEQCNMFNCTFTTHSLRGGDGELNQLSMDLQPLSVIGSIPPYFNFVDIGYPSLLQPANGRLDIILGDTDAGAEIRVIDSFSSLPSVFDISDPKNPAVIIGYDTTGGLVSFRADLSGAGPNRFFCGTIAGAYPPSSIQAADVLNLRAPAGQTDLIVVTSRALAPHVNEYVDYRSGQGYSIQVVSVEDMIDNFSYGLNDPTAIRDFLKFTYENPDIYPDPAPSAVLFVGDASYDFLDNLGTGVPNHVPSYINPKDYTYSDDNYVYFGAYGILDSDGSYLSGDRGYDMLAARLPVRSISEIDGIVAKIKTYESSSGMGTWRTRITLVADDEFGKYDNETIHAIQSDSLERYYIPRYLNRNKVYLWDYPFVNGQKPAVNDAIVDAFNDGSLIVNYVGHGNPDVWAHEHVLTRSTDLPRLTNSDRLSLVYAASCAIGFFDDPHREGMAEDFLSMPNGGAIGVISATRLVYSADNARLNQVVDSVLFSSDSLTICEALFVAKLLRQYPGPVIQNNDRAYEFLGDPYLRLALPYLDIEFDTMPDSLVALGQANVSGRIIDGDGQTIVADGNLMVTVYDSDREKVYNRMSNGVIVESIPYGVAGPAIFRGSASISQGGFEFNFISPLDIGYGGHSARVSAYALLDSIDGIGLIDSITVSQTLVQTTDSTGPEIVYGIVGRSNFVSGDAVSVEETLRVILSDESGINLAGGLGHGISLVVDRQTEDAVNLTQLFEYQQDDFTTGELVYVLNGLAPGEHLLKVKAWDNANNVSTVEFSLQIISTGGVAMNEVLNYPNPMGDSTTFYFELTQPIQRLSMRIFTLSGRRIWSSEYYDLSPDYYPNDEVQIGWNGKDTDGDRVASGVYIFKATAVPLAGAAVEKFVKVVVMN